jgi:hypothetical protein
VRAYLAERMRALGLTVETQPVTLDPVGARQVRRWGLSPGPMANLVGVLPGRDRTRPAVLLMAHHDTVPGSPGAPDDTAGVAAILETVRALKAGPARARDLIVVFTDAEEPNLDGARAFFARHPLARRVGAVVNLEARGGGGRALMFETGPGNGAMVGLYARAAARPSANSLAVWVYSLMPNLSDFTLARRAGLPGFNLAFLGRPALYHAPQASPPTLDRGSLQHLGGQTLGIVRALVTAGRLPAKAPDAVFADLFGLWLVVYPSWVGWILLGAAAALLALAWGEVRPRPLAAVGAALRGLGLLLVAGGTLQGMNMLSGAGRGANYYDRLAAIPRLEWQAFAVCGAVGLVAVFARAADAWTRWLGLAGLLLAAAAAMQAFAPAAAPLLAWPLLLVAAGAAAASRFDRGFARPWMLGLLALFAALGLGQGLALAHLAFLGVGADAPAAMAVFLVLALALVWPLLAGVPRRPMLMLAAGLAVAAVGLALWVRLDPLAPSVPAYSLRP